jgi:hypothetical protein
MSALLFFVTLVVVLIGQNVARPILHMSKLMRNFYRGKKIVPKIWVILVFKKQSPNRLKIPQSGLPGSV